VPPTDMHCRGNISGHSHNQISNCEASLAIPQDYLRCVGHKVNISHVNVQKGVRLDFPSKADEAPG
jgi:hypothetical protein